MTEPLTDQQLQLLVKDIQALRARVADLETTLNIFVAATETANLRVAKLEKALRPFAEIFSPPMSLAAEVAEARAALKDAPE